MLKLPKGLKKKKKKSKKDQELFTEEELEQYKREQRAKQGAAVCAASTAGTESDAPSDCESVPAVDAKKSEASAEGEEEWAKFKALTSGVDSIVHKTQDELQRIKQSSFFQREPTPAEKKKLEEEEAAAREAERLEKERLEAEERERNRDKLAEAVVQLSESEDESEEIDDIFNTGYIDAITSGEIGIIVPDSPVEVDLGPDPFDTGYAEKVIVGANKAKNPEKRFVRLGAAVEVLSGRVDREVAVQLSQPKRKIRKGIVNLLSEDQDHLTYLEEERAVTPEPPKTLLDDLVDEIPDIPDAPIDLLAFQPASEIKEVKKEEPTEPKEIKQTVDFDILSEFDILQQTVEAEDDEFAELAAESFQKRDEVKLVVRPESLIQITGSTEGNWSQFEQFKNKPGRPPPPGRPGTGPHIVEEDDDLELDAVDPFDTSYVASVVKEDDPDDFDFDPRAGEEQVDSVKVLTQDDLLEGTVAKPKSKPVLQVINVESEDFDPFDTTVIEEIVKPTQVELKYIRQRELEDDDFDPRAEDEKKELDTASRKSSLTLNLQSKNVGFLVPSERDLLALGANGGKHHKPLTPYYAPVAPIIEKESEDPFDTSFVPEAKPTDIELKNIEKDLVTPNLRHSLSDPEFDPRALEEPSQPDNLLSVDQQIDIKVLTPAQESKFTTAGKDIDPFDTSAAANLGPGKTELKILESELIDPKTPEIETGVLDTLDEKQEIGIGGKVLTPQPTLPEEDPEEVEIDPFDTSFATDKLAPGKTEIKLLENELIEK